MFCRATGWLTALSAGLVLAAAAFAQDVLPVPALNGRVIDQTATLSAAQSAALTDKLAAIEADTGSQIVVLLVPTTQPEDIASYAQRVADQWKIGRRDVGDGLVVLVAKNDRQVRIEVAKTLEGAIPDLAAKRIISQQITPAFRAGDFAGGLDAAVDQLAARIKGEALPAPAARPDAERGLQWEELAMFFFVGVPVLGTVLTTMLGRKFGSVVTGGLAGGLGWWITASTVLAGAAALLALVLVGVLGIGSSGRRAAGRGSSHGIPPVIWGGSGSWGSGGGWGGGGGGGFSSGGGGDFGGGGASGSW
ncbi:TPM domain-containing protein [Piscinibacter sp.]|uniref:TPM domain-containing protein n=1 Tax=Piscinibacter sp. TaxID=1903157 RepID=UPI002C9BB187|nr:TPM domain-containing protein [Albitalea sp.]HUG24971.1 TPM domain-containing protein [Albitalea sp.]